MKINENHLSYCTNVHAGETIDEILANLVAYTLPIKQTMALDLFGLGLRLSHRACMELAENRNIERLKSLCLEHGFYIFTLNGFIYGHFHEKPVKELVYLPDWASKERLQYTNALAYVLAQLLPENLTLGSISTAPLGFAGNITENQVRDSAENLALHVAKLHQLELLSGKTIVLALEPEPSCYLENSSQVIEFFERWIFRHGRSVLARELNISSGKSEELLRKFLGICYDTCHLAIAFEDPIQSMKTLSAAGIAIHKMQISNAPVVRFHTQDRKAIDWLLAFDEPIYLHQVMENSSEGMCGYVDLPQVFSSLNKKKQSVEWRIHFHVPIFLDTMQNCATTQQYICDVLAQRELRKECRHYEVETYTWNVLPVQYRKENIVDAITRELQWAKKLCQK